MGALRLRWRLLVLGVVLAVVAAGCAGTRVWTSRYNGPGNGIDQSPRVAVSRDGNQVFVSGTSFGSVGGGAMSTIAYDAANGNESWVDVYSDTTAESVAGSPDGSQVFVTGAFDNGVNDDFVTIAYGAANGHRRWVSQYNGAGNGNDIPQSLAVSPNGTALFVTGYSTDAASSVSAYTTVAYNTTNGAKLWAKDFSGSGGIPNQGFSVGVSPDSTKVFVTGSLYDQGAFDYGTVAYNATNGAQLWVSRYSGGNGSVDNAKRLVVSPGGSQVFVTGRSGSAGTDYATVAYNATSGAQLWVGRYDGPAHGNDAANDLVVSPDGTRLFVTGTSVSDSGAFPPPNSAATVAYNTTGGAQLWVRRYDGGSGLGAGGQSVGVSIDGAKVFVAGASIGGGGPADYATLAYNGANGAPGWTSLYNGPNNGYDQATGLAVSPSGTRVFVTGSSDGGGSSSDFATIAYSLS